MYRFTIVIFGIPALTGFADQGCSYYALKFSKVEIFKKWDEIPEKSRSSSIRTAGVALAIIFLPLVWTQVLLPVLLARHFQTRKSVDAGLKLDGQPARPVRPTHASAASRFLRGLSVN